jgi:hypothetical protein
MTTKMKREREKNNLMDKMGGLTIYIIVIIFHNFKVIDSKWKKQNTQVNDG